MTLPQTIKHAEEKLDKAEAVLDLHTDLLVEGLNSDRYRDSYQEMLAEEYVKAEQAARNAEQQFLNYEDDFKKVLTGELEPEEVEEEHGARAESWAYTETFESVKHMLGRQEVLERQVEAIDQIMQQNQLGSLKEEIREEHPWYSGDPEFRTAAEI
ncbi:MAG: hypothetical protein ABEK00_01110 [Candidatus Nanohaloarchaea archaeon]